MVNKWSPTPPPKPDVEFSVGGFTVRGKLKSFSEFEQLQDVYETEGKVATFVFDTHQWHYFDAGENLVCKVRSPENINNGINADFKLKTLELFIQPLDDGNRCQLTAEIEDCQAMIPDLGGDYD
jgi:hypothetical protein